MVVFNFGKELDEVVKEGHNITIDDFYLTCKEFFKRLIVSINRDDDIVIEDSIFRTNILNVSGHNNPLDIVGLNIYRESEDIMYALFQDSCESMESISTESSLDIVFEWLDQIFIYDVKKTWIFEDIFIDPDMMSEKSYVAAIVMHAFYTFFLGEFIKMNGNNDSIEDLPCIIIQDPEHSIQQYFEMISVYDDIQQKFSSGKIQPLFSLLDEEWMNEPEKAAWRMTGNAGIFHLFPSFSTVSGVIESVSDTELEADVVEPMINYPSFVTLPYLVLFRLRMVTEPYVEIDPDTGMFIFSEGINVKILDNDSVDVTKELIDEIQKSSVDFRSFLNSVGDLMQWVSRDEI